MNISFEVVCVSSPSSAVWEIWKTRVSFTPRQEQELSFLVRIGSAGDSVVEAATKKTTADSDEAGSNFETALTQLNLLYSILRCSKSNATDLVMERKYRTKIINE